MLGLLSRGKIVVDLGWVMLGLNIGHLVDFLLRNKAASTQITTTSTATAGPAAASTATSTSLSEGWDGAALEDNVILLRVLEVAIEICGRVEAREPGAVNKYRCLDRVEGVLLDPFFKVMDLHGFVDVLNSELEESGQSIVQLYVRSTVLVKGVVLAVTTVEQGLEGQNDVAVHDGDPVTPEEEGVKGTTGLAAILR
jgi:hypothetical protein